MNALEEHARSLGRTLLVSYLPLKIEHPFWYLTILFYQILDAKQGSDAEAIFSKWGWIKVRERYHSL
jgi:hypothetical protein